MKSEVKCTRAGKCAIPATAILIRIRLKMKKSRIGFLAILIACSMSGRIDLATAQTGLDRGDSELTLQQCAQMDDDRRRYACYDSILRPQPTEQPSATRQDPDGTIISSGSILNGSRLPRNEPARHPLPSTAQSTGLPASAFGLPEPRDRNGGRESIDVSVTAVSADAYGHLTFTTADGQVWRQTDSRPGSSRSVPYIATIREGTFGSYFLKPDDGRSLRVRRLR